MGQPVSACVSGDCGRTQVLRFTCAIRKNPCALLEGIVYYILNMGTSRNDKDNQRYLNRLHVVVDAVVTAASYLLAWWLMFGSRFADKEIGVLDMGIYFSALYFVVPGYLILYYWNKLYTPKRVQRPENEILNIIRANLIGIVLFLAGLYLANSIDRELQHFSRGMLALFAIINTISGILVRALIRRILHLMRKRGYNLKHILLVGYSRAAEAYIDRIIANPQWGYMVRGILDDNVPRGAVYKGVKVLGSIDNLPFILPENKLDEIAVTLALQDYDRLEEIVNLCENPACIRSLFRTITA